MKTARAILAQTVKKTHTLFLKKKNNFLSTKALISEQKI